MKMAIVGVLAFALSLAGTTGIVMLRHKPAPAEPAAVAPSDSAHGADSTKGAGEDSPRPDSTKGTAAPPPDSAKPAPVASPAAPLGPPLKPATAALQGLTAASMPGTPVAATHPASATHPAGTTPEEKAAFKQLGKILGSMKPAEAAKVVGFLSDGEVEGVIRQLQPRQAAALLAALPQERAGSLGRRLLVPSPTGAN